jgi:hypothetical protein
VLKRIQSLACARLRYARARMRFTWEVSQEGARARKHQRAGVTIVRVPAPQ